VFHVAVLGERAVKRIACSRLRDFGFSRRSRRSFLFVLAARALLTLGVLASSTVRSAAQIFPTPSPPPYSEAAVQTYFYDEEGQAGLVPAWSYLTSPSTTLEVFVSDCSTTHLFYPAGYANFILPPGCSGSPFDFQIRVPGVGYYEGHSYVDFYYTRGTSEYYPIFVIPTTSERLGKEMGLESRYYQPPENGQAMGILVHPFLSNSVSLKPTYATWAQASSVPVLGFDVAVRYYSPSNHELIRAQQAHLVVRDYNSDYIALLLEWSGYTDTSGYPSDWRLDDSVPTATLSISIGTDGYSTDTIVVEPQNLKLYEWRPLLRPLPDRPNVYRPTGLYFDRVIPAWMRPLIEDIMIAILYSEPGPDENQDGVVDVSDILDILKQGP